MTFKKKLTPEEEEELVNDYKAGMSAPKAAELYGISSRTVYYILGRHGAPTRPRKGASNQRRNRSAPVILQPCGTDAAYNRHIYHKELACGPCLEAHREMRKARKNKVKRQLEKLRADLRKGLKVSIQKGPDGIPIVISKELDNGHD